MPKFQISISINKHIDEVYKAFINPDNMLKWTKDLERVESIHGKFGEIGATAHLHYNQNGRKHILEDKLLHLEPGKRIVSQIKGGGLIAEVETQLHSMDRATKLSMTWNGKGTNLITKVILTLMKTKIQNGALEELNIFKKLIETYGIKFQD